MKYISIDIETTGLDPLKDQVLSFGAILEDTTNPLPFDKIPKFHAAIKRDRIEGGLYAINMNKKLLETINNYMSSKDSKESVSCEIEADGKAPATSNEARVGRRRRSISGDTATATANKRTEDDRKTERKGQEKRVQSGKKGIKSRKSDEEEEEEAKKEPGAEQ